MHPVRRRRLRLGGLGGGGIPTQLRRRRRYRRIEARLPPLRRGPVRGIEGGPEGGPEGGRRRAGLLYHPLEGCYVVPLEGCYTTFLRLPGCYTYTRVRAARFVGLPRPRAPRAAARGGRGVAAPQPPPRGGLGGRSRRRPGPPEPEPPGAGRAAGGGGGARARGLGGGGRGVERRGVVPVVPLGPRRSPSSPLSDAPAGGGHGLPQLCAGHGTGYPVVVDVVSRRGGVAPTPLLEREALDVVLGELKERLHG
eukprot:1191486-Prorocentrum_minimum.AAC.1